ncbi:hypothetical protein [Piscirickettsia litoralis]|uniref:hypothetical protein n=1 Tax=Piscirickettsia litoralis TaxID=1891921 RepID=UPI0013019A24|nr:hypothetical protein [Piscirickettsia litoralis]
MSKQAKDQQPLLFEVAVFKNGSLKPESIKRFTRCSEAQNYHKELFNQLNNKQATKQN